MDFKRIIESSDYTIYDYDALNEYMNLISIPYDGSEYSELHHILPKSMFDDYIHEDTNLVRLEYQTHIKAHELLAKIFDTYGMKLAHNLMTCIDIDRKILMHHGEYNPAKSIEVRKRISESKTGVRRSDMKGKKFFGASDETIRQLIIKTSKKLKNTVCVKDEAGNRFRVDVNDPRYLSKELVPFNLGESRPNSAAKRPEFIKGCIAARTKNYERFSTMTFDDMVKFLVESSEKGKNIFPKDGSKAFFAKNFSGYCKRSQHDQSLLKEAVVQRLSKG